MRYIVLILMSILFIRASAQNNPVQAGNDNVRGPGQSRYCLMECGIVFLSEKTYCPIYEQVQLCNDYQKIFFLENIPIDKSDLSSLHLKKHDLDENNCIFVQRGNCDSTAVIVYHVKLSIPVYIDGTKLENAQYLSSERFDTKLLTFKKEKHFFRKNKIIVETKN